MTDSPYTAPLEDIRFAWEAVTEMDSLLQHGDYAGHSMDMYAAVLDEAARFAEQRLAPLNRSGDRQKCRLENGEVRLPDGFADAYREFVQQGWNAAPFPAGIGGQGLPYCVSAALQEIWHGANLSFALTPLLTQSAVHLLMYYGDPWQRAHILPRLVSGEWCGTMCMTEPQAGSDVGANRAQAALQDDGTYRIKGTKIFISAGDHDAAGNIIHMVLARLPDAPEGTKGLSLFLVPKFLIHADGTLGARNDVQAVSLEHKMGMHASPTAVMAFGDEGGAVATLVGEPHQGMKAMFVMMNSARIGVGIEGLGIAGAASQAARRYAAERVQGRDAASGGKEPVTIDHHRDVQRMLTWMDAHTQGLRALSLYTNRQIDTISAGDGKAARQAKARLDLLTPVVKAHTTALAFDIASEAMQVHGGLGYIEETGIAQYLRDIRVTMIYEGTNGIQALDLALRKLPMEKGEVMRGLIEEMRGTAAQLDASRDYRLQPLGKALATALTHLHGAYRVMYMQALATLDSAMPEVPANASAVPFLRLFGLSLQGWLLAKEALHAVALEQQGGNSGFSPAFLSHKIAVARFFLLDCLLDAAALHDRVKLGETALIALPPLET